MGTPLGMVYDQLRPDERMIIEAARSKGISLHIYDAEELEMEIDGAEPVKRFEQVVLQRCISYFRSIHLTALLESMAVKVINSFAVASICGNKLLTSLALSKAKVPNPRTIIAFTPESALRALDRVGYPAILKPLIGSWGRLVVPLKDPESAKAILEDREFMYPLYQVYYIQEMVQRPPRDIRCFVIDGEAVAAMYRYSVPGEWRTNVARGGRTEPCKITPELREISIRAAEAVGEGVFGVDLVESTKGLLVLEVNYTTEFQGIVKATGVDIPGSILEYALEVAKR